MSLKLVLEYTDQYYRKSSSSTQVSLSPRNTRTVVELNRFSLSFDSYNDYFRSMPGEVLLRLSSSNIFRRKPRGFQMKKAGNAVNLLFSSHRHTRLSNCIIFSIAASTSCIASSSQSYESCDELLWQRLEVETPRFPRRDGYLRIRSSHDHDVYTINWDSFWLLKATREFSLSETTFWYSLAFSGKMGREMIECFSKALSHLTIKLCHPNTTLSSKSNKFRLKGWVVDKQI